MSAPIERPLTWSITKCENLKPVGIQDLTLYQTQFNPHRDYIERDSSGNIIAMWADYFDYDPLPKLDEGSDIPDEYKPLQKSAVLGKIEATSAVISVGGSYKNLTLKIYDDQISDVTDITEKYKDAAFKWECSIGGKDYTDKVTWRKSDFNQIKLKFPNDRSQLGNDLLVKCTVTLGEETIETTTLFGLKI